MKLWFNWRFEGTENIPDHGPALVAANHTSYFDPLAHAYMIAKTGRRPRFLAKSELFEGWFMKRVLNGARQIPVYRGTGSRAPLDAALKALEDGEVVIIFPEGTVTRNPDHTPMEGKTGVARLTLASCVPVTPMAQWGGHRVFEKNGPKGLTFARPVWVKAGTPMDFSEYESRRDDPAVLRRVTDEIMAEVSRLVADLRNRYPKRWSEQESA
jgi:1-acyl-sn-glycerol-3-phosphate acyltransferase